MAAYLAGVQERLKAAELAHAAATARAEEATHRATVERDRRRLAVALAMSVVLLVVTGGGGAAWYIQQRQAVQARIDLLVHQASLAIERAETDNPVAAPARWDEARVALGQAEAVAGRTLAAATTARLNGLRSRMARAGKLRTLLVTLEAIRGNQGEHWDPGRSDREYAAAFNAFGLDLDQGDSQAAAAALGGCAATPELAAALDDWAEVRLAMSQPQASRRRLVAAARAADPDPWRNELRNHIDRPRTVAEVALARLASDATALERQPISGLILLARSLQRVNGAIGPPRSFARRGSALLRTSGSTTSWPWPSGNPHSSGALPTKKRRQETSEPFDSPRRRSPSAQGVPRRTRHSEWH